MIIYWLAFIFPARAHKKNVQEEEGRYKIKSKADCDNSLCSKSHIKMIKVKRQQAAKC